MINGSLRNIILICLLFLFGSPKVFAQFNSCSGSLTGTDIPDYPTTVQIGDGTTGYIKICFTDNSIGTAKCSGTESHVRFYNGDGTYETGIGAGVNTCVTLKTNDGYAELSKYCWSGSADLSWTTVNANGQDVCTTCSADSDCAGNTTCDGTYCNGCATPGSSGNSAGTGATTLDQCGTSFSTSLSGVTTYGQNTGTDAYNFNDLQDIDCNDATSSGGTNGEDANFTWEQGLWYKFCPQDVGDWEVNMTASNCDQGDGVQLVAYQGNPGNLHTKFFEYSYGMNTTQTMNITNTSECVYLILDGYAGDVCDVDMSLSCTDCGCTLPVELVSFKGEAKEKGNLLKWRTLSEEDNSHFILERSRTGADFEAIAEIEGKGTSAEEHRYSFLDEEAPQGVSYYRLKQEDRDGEVHTYETVLVDREKAVEAVAIDRVYPNPVKMGDELKLQVRSDMLREVGVKVYDRTGREVLNTRDVLEKGKNILRLDPKDLSQGFYSVALEGADGARRDVSNFVVDGKD